jgi:hypothetical protein
MSLKPFAAFFPSFAQGMHRPGKSPGLWKAHALGLVLGLGKQRRRKRLQSAELRQPEQVGRLLFPEWKSLFSAGSCCFTIIAFWYLNSCNPGFFQCFWNNYFNILVCSFFISLFYKTGLGIKVNIVVKTQN